jgi:hypothetical protein
MWSKLILNREFNQTVTIRGVREERQASSSPAQSKEERVARFSRVGCFAAQ